jgi:hypothetical protein
MKQLTMNLHPNLIEIINQSPSKFLAVVPFGGGKKFNEDNIMAGAQITLFIKSLATDQECEELSVAKATPATPPKKEFDPPWIYILEGGSPNLRQFLLWQQTFALNPKLAFTIIPFDTTSRSWVIANITGDVVTNELKTISRALGVIKNTLYNDQEYRNITYQCIAIEGAPNPIECALQSTLTFELHFVANQLKGDAAPMWILTGKPITLDESLHQKYLQIIRRTTFFVGMHKLEIEKRWLDCVWCKADTHPSHQCNLPETDGWLGPKPTRSELLDLHPSSRRGRGGSTNAPRGQRGSRSSRPRGGRGRGRK